MGKDWKREVVADKRDELREKEDAVDGAREGTIREDFVEQNPRNRKSRAVSYHR